MKAGEIIESHLKSIGADGLCNRDMACGCGIGDLAPCECLNLEFCEPAKFIKPKKGDPEWWDEWPEGYYQAIEVPK